MVNTATGKLAEYIALELNGGERPDSNIISVNECPVCGRNQLLPWGHFRTDLSLGQCQSCSLVLRLLQSTDAELLKIYSEDHYNYTVMTEASQSIWDMKVRSAMEYLQLLEKTGQQHGNKGRLLDIGCAQGFMLEAATILGYDACGLEMSPAAKAAAQKEFKIFEGSVEDSVLPNSWFKVATMIDVIEHLRNPKLALRKVNRALESGGTLIIVTPDVSSFSATLLRGKWPHFMPEHLCYYSADTLKHLLSSEGYETLVIQPGFKFLNYDYVLRHFERYAGGWATAFLRGVRRILPTFVTRQAVKVRTELVCISIKRD